MNAVHQWSITRPSSSSSIQQPAQVAFAVADCPVARFTSCSVSTCCFCCGCCFLGGDGVGSVAVIVIVQDVLVAFSVLLLLFHFRMVDE